MTTSEWLQRQTRRLADRLRTDAEGDGLYYDVHEACYVLSNPKNRAALAADMHDVLELALYRMWALASCVVEEMPDSGVRIAGRRLSDTIRGIVAEVCLERYLEGDGGKGGVLYFL
jgi:hypothetical protein